MVNNRVQCQLIICRGPFSYQRHLLRIFVINCFLVNWEIVKKIFDWLLWVSCSGWEVKNNMNGQSTDSLRVCNVKIRKCLPGWKWDTILRMHSLIACSIKWFKMWDYRWTSSLAVENRFWPIGSRSRWGTCVTCTGPCILADTAWILPIPISAWSNWLFLLIYVN